MARAITASPPGPASGAGSANPAGRRNALATLGILVVTGVLIIGAAYLSNPRLSDTGAGNFTPVTVNGQPAGAAPALGQPAPDFATELAGGDPFRLSDLRGGAVWLTFGASWCQPCRAENPDILATARANRERLTVVQVYMAEDATTVNDYVARVGIDYLAVPDPGERLSAQYRILGIPSHFFIDAQGVLRQIKVGSLDPVAMQAAVDALAQ